MNPTFVTKISRSLVITLLFLLPLFFLPLDLIATEPLKIFTVLFVAILLGTIIVLKKIKANSFFISKSWILLSVPVVLVVGLLSSLFSNNIMISLIGRQINLSSFLGLFVLFAFAYIISILFTETKAKTQLFLTVYISALLVIVMQLLNIFVPVIPSLGFFVSNTVNTVGQWSDLGLLSLFTLLTSILILQHLQKSNFYNILGLVGTALSAVLLVLVNSLFLWALAGIFALLCILFGLLLHQTDAIQKRIPQAALIVLVISVILILLGGKIGVLLNQTLDLRYEEVRPTLMSTFEVSKDTLQQKPVLGYGINRFETSWLLNRPTGVNLSNYWDTDFKYGYSHILSIPTTQGILGILAWLMFVFAVITLSFKMIIHTISTKSDIFINTYSVLGALFFLTAMLAYNPSIVLTTLGFVFFGLLFSSANSAGLLRYKEVVLEKNPRSALSYLLILVVVLIAFVYSGYVVATQYASRVIFENASKEYSVSGDITRFENRLLLSQFIFSSDLYLRTLANAGLIKINALLQNNTLTQDQAAEQFRNILGQTIQYSQAAIVYDRQSYLNQIELSAVYKNLVQLEVQDAKTEALAVLEQANALSPNNPTIILEKARIYVLAKDISNAKDQISQALELKPNFVDALFLRSQIQVEEGDIDGATMTLRDAIVFQPQNATLYFQLGLVRYNQSSYSDAVVLFENAVTRSPYFANAKYFLGLAYYNDSRTQDAIAQFEDLNLMYPDNADVTKILSNLKAGRAPLNGVSSLYDQDSEIEEQAPSDESIDDSDDSNDDSV